MTHTYVVGAALGLKTLSGLQFNLEASYTGCLICGEVYQSRLDRKVLQIEKDAQHPLRHLLPSYRITSDRLRKEWARKHAKSHPDIAHKQLRESGQFCTPEAALKLVPLGIFPLDSTDDGLDCAMAEAPRAPKNDAQGYT